MSIVVERFRDVGHAAGAQDIESKAAHTGKDARVVADAAAVFPEAHITHIVLAILDAPMPTYGMSTERRTHRGRAVADVILDLQVFPA